MPTIGENKIKFGRSYVFLNPQVDSQYSSTGVWRLTNQDISSGVDTSDLIKSATVQSGSSSISIGQPVYINSSGNAALADASSLTTSKVAGIATTTGIAGAQVSFTRNQGLTIPNVNTVVDNVSNGLLEPGKYYWLSINTGKLTRTPDTSTSGSVLIQIGLALTTSELQVEIQAPVVI
jgi:hypothetical protein